MTKIVKETIHATSCIPTLCTLPEQISVFTQPFLRSTIIGKDLLDDGIKCGGVVHLFAMCKFVDNDVIEDCRGSEDQSPVEV